MNTIKEKVLKLNPEFVGHIKLFLDNGSETVKQSVTAYYEEPQEADNQIRRRSSSCIQDPFSGLKRQ